MNIEKLPSWGTLEVDERLKINEIIDNQARLEKAIRCLISKFPVKVTKGDVVELSADFNFVEEITNILDNHETP